MIKFDYSDGKVVIAPYCFTVQAFRAVWEADASVTKERATSMLTYVYLLMDPDSPFADAMAHEREVFARQDSKLPEQLSQQEADLLEQACQWYETCNDIADKRFLQVFNDKIDQMKKLVADTEPEIVRQVSERSGEIKFSSNTDILMKIMQEVEKLYAAKEKLEARIKNKSSDSKIRGGKAPSILETGKVRLTRA